MFLTAGLAPISPDYARLSVPRAFTWWDGMLGPLTGEAYLVVFRSRRRADAEARRLDEYDERAEAEAARAPGFIHYFKGPLATDGSCMSFCLWSSREAARAAIAGSAHRAAALLAGEMYERYELEFWRVSRLRPGAPAIFTPYDLLPAPAPLMERLAAW